MSAKKKGKSKKSNKSINQNSGKSTKNVTNSTVKNESIKSNDSKNVSKKASNSEKKVENSTKNENKNVTEKKDQPNKKNTAEKKDQPNKKSATEKKDQTNKKGEEKKKINSKENIVFQNSKSKNKANKKNLNEKVKNPSNAYDVNSKDKVDSKVTQNEKNKKKENVSNKTEEKKNKENNSNSKKKNDEKNGNVNSNSKNPNEKIESKDEKTPKKGHTKAIVVLIVILLILVLIFIFSTCFAFIHATKDTIARGVTIKNIDVSNLTYNDAKAKLEEAFDVAIDINIDLTYEDFSYVVTGNDIALSYELSEALDEAYNVGRTGNIFQNNYELILTAVANKNIDLQFNYENEPLDTIIQYVETNVPNLVIQYSYYIEGTELIITPGTDGIKVDSELLKNQIIDIIQNRDLTNISEIEKDIQLAIPYNEVTAKDIDIDEIYSEIYCEPQDAYYVEATETTEFEIYEDVDGIDFAISIDEAKAIIAETGLEQYVIPLTITTASVTISDIGIEAFPYQVSTFSTTYDASNTSRSKNLQIAASKINGTVLMPGEQFSFNGVVGERTVSEGYENAAIYENGQVVSGLAGGICQVSTTLYNSVLLANLQVDERYNHSFTTSYIKAGRDATVVYGVKDFKFTNTRKYPIKIEATVGNGVITFTIYGIEEENEYEVKIIPTTTSTIAYTTQTIVDSSLAAGTTVVSQAGANGCTVTTRKEVYLNGVQISNEVISNDTYQAMTRIVRVGPTVTTNIETDTSTEVTE